jgi:hypothetical protein
MTGEFDALEGIFYRLATDPALRSEYGALAIRVAKACRKAIGSNTKNSDRFNWEGAQRQKKIYLGEQGEYFMWQDYFSSVHTFMDHTARWHGRLLEHPRVNLERLVYLFEGMIRGGTMLGKGETVRIIRRALQMAKNKARPAKEMPKPF